ncbi:MAG: hypothetical protein DWQ10_03780 [Calditrichaeota bacterium]|nr:MAG: hypothetical protein DWQ10_03780 [Calditrichota bacterium]
MGFLQEDQYKKEMDPNYTKSAETAMMIPGYTNPYYTDEAEQTPKSLFASTLVAAPAPTQEMSAPAITELAPLTDAASLDSGKQIWVTNCVVCHGANGEGLIGPNMTDDYWISGQGDIAGIVEVITNGRPAKGMIPWNTTLSEQQILEVGSYLKTLQGTNPPNAKAPEGTKVEME